MTKIAIITVVVAVIVSILSYFFLPSDSIKVAKKRIMQIDKEFDFFTYSEFDSTALETDNGARYTKTLLGETKEFLKGSGEMNMSRLLVKYLDEVRREYGGAITITSGYRTPQYNSTLNGSVEDSAHIYGLAADITFNNFDDNFGEVVGLLKKYFKRIGTHMGRKFIHVDLDSSKPDAEWVY